MPDSDSSAKQVCDGNLRPFEQRLALAWPPERWLDSGVLVAFSGGADSTALVTALAVLAKTQVQRCHQSDATDAAREPIVAAHFNHRLRGAESDADARHCVETSQRIGVPCVVGEGDAATLAGEQGDGLEAAAREERYRFLETTAARLGLRYLATAHTLDDQAETVLQRMLRGTGPAGLAGIPRVRSAADGTIGLVRPLLGFRRGEVLEYVDECGLPYQTDASNADVRFTRNRIRHELLPQLVRDYNPQLVESLGRLATQADELREIVAGLVAPLAERAVVREDAASCELDCRALREVPRHLVREVLIAVWRRRAWPEQAMGFAEWDRLAAAVQDNDATTTFMLPGTVRAQKKGASLTLTRPSG